MARFQRGLPGEEPDERHDRFDQLGDVQQRCEAVAHPAVRRVLRNQRAMLVGQLALGEWWNSRCGQSNRPSCFPVGPGESGTRRAMAREPGVPLPIVQADDA